MALVHRLTTRRAYLYRGTRTDRFYPLLIEPTKGL